MIRFAVLLLSGALIAASSGCAGMMQSWREAHCHYDGAFKLGMNDARQGREMNAAVPQQCPAQVRADVEQGYRDGYLRGIGGQPATASAAWECKTAYGKKVCGYDCIAAYGQVACAARPEENCVEAYGKIRCGLNCREHYGEIVCGSAEAAQAAPAAAAHIQVSW